MPRKGASNHCIPSHILEIQLVRWNIKYFQKIQYKKVSDCEGFLMELDYRAIGKRIKIARIKADLTQEALAEKASLSTTHMSNIETGNSKLSLPTIVSLANALSVSVDEFLCDSVIHSKDIFSQEIQDLVSDCDEYEIRMIADFVRAAKETIRKNAKLKE